MDDIIGKKINRELMPKALPSRNVRYRYDWAGLEIGEGFIFAPTVKVSSARVMCANKGRDLDRIFRCFRGVDEKLYCVRVGALTDEIEKVGEPDAPRIAGINAPTIKEEFGEFGAYRGKPMPDNAKIVDYEPSKQGIRQMEKRNAIAAENEDDVI